jgi:hypothetical protein|tara:strand:+ start:3090 stop:3260 length:171 start_codon:yes stop_codon:yes gene_type:complete
MNLEQIVPSIALILILVLILPSFLKSKPKLNVIVKNLSIWGIIVIVVVVISYLILK